METEAVVEKKKRARDAGESFFSLVLYFCYNGKGEK